MNGSAAKLTHTDIGHLLDPHSFLIGGRAQPAARSTGGMLGRACLRMGGWDMRRIEPLVCVPR